MKILGKLGDGLAWIGLGLIPPALRLFMGERTEVRLFDEDEEATAPKLSQKTSVVFEITIILVIIWLLILIAFAVPRQKDNRPPPDPNEIRIVSL